MIYSLLLQLDRLVPSIRGGLLSIHCFLVAEAVMA